MSITEVDKNLPDNYDLVGLGCPVFYNQEPFNVSDFLENLPVLTGRHWFLFCTHGSVIGNTFPSMTERLQKKGVTIVGYHDTYADGTLPFYPYPTLTTGHPDSQELKEAYDFGREVAQRSQQNADGLSSLIPELKPVPDEWVKTAKMMNLEFMKKAMPRLRIEMDKCIHCHECENNCPGKGIDVAADPPRIQEPRIAGGQTYAIDISKDLIPLTANFIGIGGRTTGQSLTD